MVNKLVKKVKKKALLKKYTIFCLAMLVGAINFNILIKPSKIVAGGVNGLAILFEDFIHIPPSLFIFIFSGGILLISIFTLGITKASSILLFTIIYPAFVKITSPISSFLYIDNSDLFIYSILIGITTGIVNGVCYRIGLGAGPLPLISQIIHKYTKQSLGKITFLINATIIIVSGYKYGIEKLIYALIIIYVNSQIIDKILFGFSSNKLIYIFSSKQASIEECLINEKNTYQLIPVKDVHSNFQKSLILVSIKTSKYPTLKDKLTKMDENLLIITLDLYEKYEKNYYNKSESRKNA